MNAQIDPNHNQTPMMSLRAVCGAIMARNTTITQAPDYRIRTPSAARPLKTFRVPAVMVAPAMAAETHVKGCTFDGFDNDH